MPLIFYYYRDDESEAVTNAPRFKREMRYNVQVERELLGPKFFNRHVLRRRNATSYIRMVCVL